MNKIEYLLRRYAGEYSKWCRIFSLDNRDNERAHYFYERLRRKGLALESLYHIGSVVEHADGNDIGCGSEVDCEIKTLVAYINLKMEDKYCDLYCKEI